MDWSEQVSEDEPKLRNRAASILVCSLERDDQRALPRKREEVTKESLRAAFQEAERLMLHDDGAYETVVSVDGYVYWSSNAPTQFNSAILSAGHHEAVVAGSAQHQLGVLDDQLSRTRADLWFAEHSLELLDLLHDADTSSDIIQSIEALATHLSRDQIKYLLIGRGLKHLTREGVANLRARERELLRRISSLRGTIADGFKADEAY